MPERQFGEERVFTTEMRVVDVDRKTFTGRAAPFDKWTPINGSYLERLVADTFADSVTRGRGQSAPLLERHDHKKWPIGKPVEWRTDSDGLYATWEIDTGSERGAEAYRLVSEGFVRGLSVGFTGSPDDDIDTEGDVTRITRINNPLHEVSLVSVPAYPDAQILAVRSEGIRRAPDPRIAAIRKEMGLL